MCIPLQVKSQRYRQWIQVKHKHCNESKETEALSWTVCGRQSKNQKEESNNGEGENLTLLKGEYTVESIDEKLKQTYYTLEGYNRPLLRHELLNI